MVQCSALRDTPSSYDSTDDGSEGGGAFRTSETFELLGKSKAAGGCRMQPRSEDDYNQTVAESEAKFWLDCASSYLGDLPSSLLFATKQRRKTKPIISWKSKRTPNRRIRSKNPSSSVDETFETTLELEEHTSGTSRSETLTVEEATLESSTKPSEKKGKVLLIPVSSENERSIAGAMAKVAKTYSSISASEFPQSDSSKEPSLLVLDLTALDDAVPKINGKNIPTIKVPSNPTTPRSPQKASTPKAGRAHQFQQSPKLILGGAIGAANSRKARGVDPPAKPVPDKKPIDNTNSKYRYGSPEKARRCRSPQKMKRHYDLPACPSIDTDAMNEATIPEYVSTDCTSSTEVSSDDHISKESSLDGTTPVDTKSSASSSISVNTPDKENKKSKLHRHRRSRSVSTGRKPQKGKFKHKKRSKSELRRSAQSPTFFKLGPIIKPRNKNAI